MWGLDKVKEWLDFDEDVDYDEDELEEFEEEDDKPAMQKTAAVADTQGATAFAARPSAVLPQSGGASPQRPKLTVHTTKVSELAVEIHVPSNFDQVARIADDLLLKRAAIVNFERVDAAEQLRICDFINGVSYILDCEARPIAARMALYVPSGVDITTAKPTSVK